MNLSRRKFNFVLSGAVLIPAISKSSLVSAAQGDAMTVYKSPYCGCCGAWIDHVKASGIRVKVTDMEDVTPVKRHYGIPPELHSCHTAVVAGYVIEGHVPAGDIMRLILNAPVAKGLAVPGMPIGSPGMEQGSTREPYSVLLFGDKGVSVFSRYNGA